MAWLLVGLTSCAPSIADVVEAETSDNDAAGWQLVWSDEFDGNALDRTKWAPEVSCWGGGNNERQCYTDRVENVGVGDGLLRLTARAEDFTGPLYPLGMTGAPGGERTQDYTSGKVRTLGLAGWRYGRISARIQVPSGQGTWPAFWMMPVEDTYGTWPLSGEIDIMEAINQETPCGACPGGIERRTSGALHFGDYIPENTYLYLSTSGEDEIGPANAWRVYSVEWAEGVIQWFVDDDIFMRIESDDWFTAAPEAEGRPHAPFDQPFYLNINLAVGGNLAEKKNGGGFDPSSFPADLKVDWVRVEQCGADETGLACLTETDWDGSPEGPWETQAR
ncbi:MAG: glycoside hydrolase family 16 protein [Pseudomonadota bacterium]